MRRLLPLLFVTTACHSFLDQAAPPPPPPAGSPTLQLVDSFASPVYLTAPPGDSSRLFVVEQGGRIKVVHNDTTRARPVLRLLYQSERQHPARALPRLARSRQRRPRDGRHGVASCPSAVRQSQRWPA